MNRIAKVSDMKLDSILVVYSEKLSKKHLDTVAKIRQILDGKKFLVLRADRLEKKYFEGINFVISVGGDGTFIRAASFFKDKLIVGINSEPESSEGALLCLKENELDFLKEILDGKYKVIKKPRIKIKINDREMDSLALNEIYFGSLNQFHNSHYIIDFFGVKEEQRSSGVLVSTASGSTAWYKSARGRPFKGNKLKFIVREPFVGGRLFNPKLLKGELKKGEKIGFTSKRHSGGVVAIDSNYIYRLNFGDRVDAEISEFPLKVVMRKI